MGGIQRVFLVHMVGHIVEDEVHVGAVRGVHQSVELVAGPETGIEFGVGDGPISVVPAEAARHVRRRILPISIGAIGISGERGDPQCRYAEAFEIAIFKSIPDAREVPAVVVGAGVDGGIVDGAIVVRVAIAEPVDHHEVEDLGLPVLTAELARVGDGDAVEEGDAHLCTRRALSRGPQPQVGAAGTIGGSGDSDEARPVFAEDTGGVEVVFPPRPHAGARGAEQAHVVDLIAAESDGGEFNALRGTAGREQGVESAEAIVHALGIVRVGHLLAVDDQLIGVFAIGKGQVNGPSAVRTTRQGRSGARPAIESAHDLDVGGPGEAFGQGVADLVLVGGQNGHVRASDVHPEFECT